MRRPRRLPSLTALRAFEAAATHLSFLRAARELSVTPTAISHQVRGLEGTLGQPLFRRLPRQLELTPAGARLLQDLAKSFDAIEASVVALRPQPGTTTVTLTTNTAFAARWVLPRLGTLAQDCPGVRLRLQSSEAIADLQRGDADLAIRHGRGGWPGLVVQPLMVERYAPVCSPALGLESPQDLQRHALIHLDWQAHACAPALWGRWFEQAGLVAAHPGATGPALSFSDETQAMAAALGGHGVALLSLTLAADELRRGALVQPFGPALETGSYYIATARGREANPPSPPCGSGSPRRRPETCLQRHAAWQLLHAAPEQAAFQPPPQPPLCRRQVLGIEPALVHPTKLPHKRKDREIGRARRIAAKRWRFCTAW